jgi:MoxR-like ATPase
MKPELAQLVSVLNQHILGKQPQLKLAITCLLANGHLLIEDLPGMGKTTLSHALAKCLGMAYSRIQFTSDLLPADVLGVNVFDSQQQAFIFHPGPLFNQVVLADEINRASPKTQSALLEAMEEKQISIDGTTYPLPSPFFVIGTQNPSYQAGTYPLPESQLDRFLMRISLGYPDWEAEKKMLTNSQKSPLHEVNTQISLTEFKQLQQEVSEVTANDAILDYLLRLVDVSRKDPKYEQALSPRASKALLQAAKAWALLHGRDYVKPEDIQAVFVAVAEHRLKGSNHSHHEGHVLSQQILDSIDPLAA